MSLEFYFSYEKIKFSESMTKNTVCKEIKCKGEGLDRIEEKRRKTKQKIL